MYDIRFSCPFDRKCRHTHTFGSLFLITYYISSLGWQVILKILKMINAQKSLKKHGCHNMEVNVHTQLSFIIWWHKWYPGVPEKNRPFCWIILFVFLGLYPGLLKSGKFIFLCVINSSTFNYGHCSCKKNPLHPVVFSINPLLTLWVTILQCIIDIVSCCYDTCTPCIIIYIDSPWNSYLVYWCYLCSTVIIISCILEKKQSNWIIKKNIK